jgi:hypothetical protein
MLARSGRDVRCPQCQEVFWIVPSRPSTFCSSTCAGLARQTPGRVEEHIHDMSPAAIERVIAARLREVKRTKLYTIDPHARRNDD